MANTFSQYELTPSIDLPVTTTRRPIDEPQAGAFDSQIRAVLGDDLVPLFKMLSDETRLRIIYLLGQNSELHVRALSDSLQQSQPAVSHHLAMLRRAGLVCTRRDGKHNYYRLASPRLQDLLNKILAMIPMHARRGPWDDFVKAQLPAGIDQVSGR